MDRDFQRRWRGRASCRAACMLAMAAWAAQPALAQCTVERLQGGAFALRGEGRPQPLRMGQRLVAGDEIRTAAKGRVRLRCADGSMLTVANQTQLRIERFEAAPGQPRWASFWLKLGLIGQTVSPSPGGRWQVRTPTAVTAVRGTAYVVEVRADQGTDVQVTEGEVAVAPLNPVSAPSAASAASAMGSTDSSVGSEAYASKALVGVVPALVLSAAQPGLRCGVAQCLPEAHEPQRLKTWQQRLGW